MRPMNSETTKFADLPPSLKAERHGAVAVLRLNRAQKRNALDDPMVAGIETFFSGLPEDIRAVVLCGEGEHFSAGLDLTELVDRATVAGIAHSRSWHRAFDRIEFGSVPVVAAVVFPWTFMVDVAVCVWLMTEENGVPVKVWAGTVPAVPVKVGTPAGQLITCAEVVLEDPLKVGTPAGQEIVGAETVPAGVKDTLALVPAGVKLTLAFVPAGV